MATCENVEVCLEVKKVGMNWRRIESKIDINANFDTIWKVLTDYQRFPDFIPGISQIKIIHTKGNCVRLSQTGQEELPLGLKISAQMILDFSEKDFETCGLGTKKRVLEFKMVEGDFQILEGKYSVEEQVNGDDDDDDDDDDKKQESERKGRCLLWYSAQFKPKIWIPFKVIEGRLCKNIKTHLSSVRQEAQKLMIDAPPSVNKA